MKKIIGIIITIIVILLILAMGGFFVLRFMQNTGIIEKYEKTNLIINGKNVTDSLKYEMIIEGDMIFLARQDVRNFFDTDMCFTGTDKRIVTTTDTKVATMVVGEDVVIINDEPKNMSAHAFQQNNTTYIPLSELKDFYNIELTYNEETNVIIIDSLNKKQVKANLKKNDNVQTSKNLIGKFIDKVEKGEEVVVISAENQWSKVRTTRGFIGYLKTDSLTDIRTVREDYVQKESVFKDKKISLVWDYFSSSKPVPDRSGTEIDGVNVVSPTFFEIERLGKGAIVDKASNGGKEYVRWAHKNNYQVWALISKEGWTETISEILNSYENRNRLINNILAVVELYNLDGINIDFEGLYKDDKDMFSQFIIELYPRLKEKNVILSVDVTAPDGAENWSECYDRLTIGRNCDYVIFMAYDQHGDGSKNAGSTAGYDWVSKNVEKFLKKDSVNEVPAAKLILGVPFYTRVWTVTASGTTTSAVTSMKKQYSNIPTTVKAQWLDDVQQYYAEWKDGANTKKIWLEEENSIKAKLSLITDNNLAGAAFWVKDREEDSIWKVIKEELNK